jgi:hypothetical protein
MSEPTKITVVDNGSFLVAGEVILTIVYLSIGLLQEV